MSQVAADFFCIKTDHDLSLTFPMCFWCLNITIKRLYEAVVTTSGYILTFPHHEMNSFYENVIPSAIMFPSKRISCCKLVVIIFEV